MDHERLYPLTYAKNKLQEARNLLSEKTLSTINRYRAGFALLTFATIVSGAAPIALQSVQAQTITSDSPVSQIFVPLVSTGEEGEVNAAVVGGHDADPNNTAAKAMIETYFRSSQAAEGSIVQSSTGDYKALLARHAAEVEFGVIGTLDNTSPTELGDLEDPEKQIVIFTSRIDHPRNPETQPTYYADVSVLDFANAQLPPNANPIRLVPGNYQLAPGQSGEIFGRGLTQDISEGGEVAPTLQQATVNIVPDSSMSGYGSSFNTAVMFGAGGINQNGQPIDTCNGDSSGIFAVWDATINDWRQAGVISFGNKCADPNFPGAYADVASLRSWINPAVNGAIPPNDLPDMHLIDTSTFKDLNCDGDQDKNEQDRVNETEVVLYENGQQVHYSTAKNGRHVVLYKEHQGNTTIYISDSSPSLFLTQPGGDSDFDSNGNWTTYSAITQTIHLNAGYCDPTIPTPTATMTLTPTPTETETSQPTDTATPTPTATLLPTNTSTVTMTPTTAPTDRVDPTVTFTFTPTETQNPTDTATPTLATTYTVIPPPTDTENPTLTPTPTHTATEPATLTLTPTPSITSSATPTFTFTPPGSTEQSIYLPLVER